MIRIVMIALVCFAVMVMPAVAADAAAGKAVYAKACKTCHGANGEGNPGMAKMLKVEMKHLGSAEAQKADWKKAIVDGMGKMKGIKTLKPAEVDDVIAFGHTLKQ